jgi:glycerol-3-phosphate dehydrogenase
VFASEVIHSCEHEMALTVTDVMRRRTGLALSRHGGVETASTVARWMANQLHWSDSQMYSSLKDYLDDHHRASRF